MRRGWRRRRRHNDRVDCRKTSRCFVHGRAQFRDGFALTLVGGIDALCEIAQILFDGSRRSSRAAFRGFQAARDIRQRMLDALEPAIDGRLGVAGFDLDDAVFEPRHGAGRLRFAGRELCGETFQRFTQLRKRLSLALNFDFFGLSRRSRGLDAFECLFHRAGAGMRRAFDRAHSIVDCGDADIERLRRMLHFVARFQQSAGDGFDIGRERRDLCRGLMCRVGDLVGHTRKTLMQALDGFAKSVAGGNPFDTRKPLVEADHMGAQLIEGLGLFARRNIYLRRGLAHGTAVFGLVAFGRVEPAGKPAQLFFDLAIGTLRLAFAARDAREHVVRIAVRSGLHGRRLRLGDITAIGAVAPSLSHRIDGLAAFGKVAQDPAGEPFAHRKTFAARSRPRGLTGLWGDAGNIPRKIRLHFGSPCAAPVNEGTGAQNLCKETLPARPTVV